jgi:hypothetical protein
MPNKIDKLRVHPYYAMRILEGGGLLPMLDQAGMSDMSSQGLSMIPQVGNLVNAGIDAATPNEDKWSNTAQAGIKAGSSVAPMALNPAVLGATGGFSALAIPLAAGVAGTAQFVNETKQEEQDYKDGLSKYMAYGGDLNIMEFGGEIDSIEGPSHAQGGIQMGANAEVEGGEARAGDYIFSDQLEHPDFPGKTFADVAKNYKKKYEERQGDPYSMATQERQLSDLMRANEATKKLQQEMEAQTQKALQEDALAYGGYITKDEYGKFNVAEDKLSDMRTKAKSMKMPYSDYISKVHEYACGGKMKYADGGVLEGVDPNSIPKDRWKGFDPQTMDWKTDPKNSLYISNREDYKNKKQEYNDLKFLEASYIGMPQNFNQWSSKNLAEIHKRLNYPEPTSYLEGMGKESWNQYGNNPDTGDAYEGGFYATQYGKFKGPDKDITNRKVSERTQTVMLPNGKYELRQAPYYTSGEFGSSHGGETYGNTVVNYEDLPKGERESLNYKHTPNVDSEGRPIFARGGALGGPPTEQQASQGFYPTYSGVDPLLLPIGPTGKSSTGIDIGNLNYINNNVDGDMGLSNLDALYKSNLITAAEYNKRRKALPVNTPIDNTPLMPLGFDAPNDYLFNEGMSQEEIDIRKQARNATPTTEQATFYDSRRGVYNQEVPLTNEKYIENVQEKTEDVFRMLPNTAQVTSTLAPDSPSSNPVTFNAQIANTYDLSKKVVPSMITPNSTQELLSDGSQEPLDTSGMSNVALDPINSDTTNSEIPTFNFPDGPKGDETLTEEERAWLGEFGDPNNPGYVDLGNLTPIGEPSGIVDNYDELFGSDYSKDPIKGGKIGNEELALFASSVPAISTYLKGLNPETTKFERVKPEMVDLSLQREQIARDAATARDTQNANVRSNAKSSGEALSALSTGNTALTKNRMAMDAESYLNESLQNVNLKNQANQMNTQIANEEIIANEQNRALAESAKSAAVASEANNVQGYLKDKKMTAVEVAKNTKMLEIINAVTPGYEWGTSDEVDGALTILYKNQNKTKK